MKAAIIDTLNYKEDALCFSDLLKKQLKKSDVSSRVVKTEGLHLIPCMGCDGCLQKTPGKCIMKDNTADVLIPITRSEIMICLTEMKFGGYSSAFKLIVDKFALLATPYYQMAKEKLVHKKRYPNPERMYIIGFTDYAEKGQSNNFQRIVHNNAINLNIGVFGSFVFEKKAFNEDVSVEVVDSILKGVI